MNIARYSAIEFLPDGRQLEIRALTPDDREAWIDYIGRTSDATRYRRFFGFKRSFSEQEIDFQVNIDLVSHVALAAVLEEDGREIGVSGARYIVTEPGRATISFLTTDAYQGLGLATQLLRHLVIVARDAGITRFDAEVLSENTRMLKVFQRSGLAMTSHQHAGVTQISLAL